MAPNPLGPPPTALSVEALRPTKLSPHRLWRISGYATGEPYFGVSGLNRFDAPGCAVGVPEYATCYLGLNLSAAIAESVLHDRDPVDGQFEIADTTLDAMFAHRFSGRPLRVLDLRGPTLKRLDGHADLAGTCRYDLTQQWSLAAYRNPQRFDGFIYMSRHDNVSAAVVLFDRAKTRINSASSQPLTATPGYAAAATAFHIVGI